MTKASRNTWIALGIVAGVQILILVGMIWERASLLRNGREIVLKVVPVDPRSLFRGDYVILNYKMTRVELPPGLKGVRRGSTLYVTLQKADDDQWEVAGVAAKPTGRVQPTEIVLKGRVRYVSGAVRATKRMATLHYGIESFFVPEGEGKKLEKLIRDKTLAAVIAVGDDGAAGIKGLMSDGQRVYKEPLY